MGNSISAQRNTNIGLIKWLTFLMFTMFAMTTDAVGVIIPEVMKQFDLSMTAAGLMHYAPMIAIALAGILLGFLADKLGRKKTIIIGLALFALNSYLFIIGNTFAFYLSLMVISGLAIGVFKTAALALIGDISNSTDEHTSTMNAVEGFFGVGAIIGPFIVSYLLTQGVDWKWLYVVAATLCVVLIVIALMVKYPDTKKTTEEPNNLKGTLKMMKDPYALGFSMGAFLYVAVECAIYVWMPTLIEGYQGDFEFVATYALSIFFILRASGRFLGAWLMAHFNWSLMLSVFSVLILVCFMGSVVGGINYAVILLPLSGLFMSVIYPTINSKGISCFPKAKHGSVAGVILFFTAAGAALGPLAMGAVSDAMGSDAKYGFILATVFAGILFLGTLINIIYNPAEKRLKELNESEY
ncbi:MFS transporter [Plebeiibacterium marinum]|uniref:MFS transporter n=1 Tax=Plebeiibacterium marinum TaxID=2992111 RepID=A0AAE3MF55_9BACT|nr:MFS transporter [Plebeiobacterium marinum]MCW3806296.1 MFS transporter [Plebeiobacterium marinum]